MIMKFLNYSYYIKKNEKMRGGFYSSQPAGVTGPASEEQHQVMSYGDGFQFHQWQAQYRCDRVVQ